MEGRSRYQVGLFSGETLLAKISRVAFGDGSDLSDDEYKWVAEIVGTKNIGILKTPNTSATRDSEDSAKNWILAEIGHELPESPECEWREID